MTLDEDQKRAVQGWISEGRPLSDIQTLLKSELGIGLTYMEVRFLVDDVGLQLKDPEPEVEPDPEPKTAAGSGAVPDAGDANAANGSAREKTLPAEPAGEQDGGGSVSIEVSAIARPGAIVSGAVTFSDGAKAEWMLDQMGRLGLIPEVEGYQASPGDIAQFQASLQEELQKLGF